MGRLGLCLEAVSETRARIITGINPVAMDQAFLVIAFSPENIAIQQLFDHVYEGDGAFYISTSDAFVVRNEKRGRLWIQVKQPTEDGVQIIAETSCQATKGAISKVTIAVQSEKVWNEIIRELKVGAFPVILGPGP